MRVRDDMGSRCRRQLREMAMNHGQKGKIARAWVFPYHTSAYKHRDACRFFPQDLKTHERAVSRQIPVRSTSSVRSSGRPLSMAAAQRRRHSGEINDGEVMFSWIRKRCSDHNDAVRPRSLHAVSWLDAQLKRGVRKTELKPERQWAVFPVSSASTN